MPERSGLELFAEDQFSSVFKKYDAALAKAEREAAQAARSITTSGRKMAAGWGTGVEDLIGRLDNLDRAAADTRIQAQDMLTTMTAGETAVGGLSGVLTALSGVAAGVGIAFGALATVGKALWSKMAEHVKEYISETESVVEAQERVSAEWEEASAHLAQALIPLTVELANLEGHLAEQIGKAAEGFKYLVAIAHATLASGIEQIKAMGQAVVDTVKGQGPGVEEAWERIRQAGASKFREVMFDYRDVFEETRTKVEEEEEKFVPDVEPQWRNLADVALSTMDRIRKMQADHNLQMRRQAEDAARARAKAWADYEKRVGKEVVKGQRALTKLEDKYRKDRTKTIADYQKRIAKAEANMQAERIEGHRDFERELRHDQERYQLDRVQSRRRFEFELSQLVAEGDTLAIEELRARYDLEQKEAAESQELQQRQQRENQTEQVRQTARAAREELAELRAQLSEALAEQESSYQEQVQQQRQANAERLTELAADFSERRRLADEDLAVQEQRRQEDYQRQLRDLGENLASEFRERGIHYGQVAGLMEQYYGPSGIFDAVLQGYHSRELERIAVTAAAMEQMAQARAPTWPAVRTPSYHPVFGMQHGGVVTGPQHIFIERGQTEAIIPLGQGSVHHTHSFDTLHAQVSGLEGASPANVNAIASALARELTNQVRALRRS